MEISFVKALSGRSTCEYGNYYLNNYLKNGFFLRGFPASLMQPFQKVLFFLKNHRNISMVDTITLKNVLEKDSSIDDFDASRNFENSYSADHF